MLIIQHLDPDCVAGLEEGRLGLAAQNGLDRSDLGDAGIAKPAFGDGFAGAAVGAAVGAAAAAPYYPPPACGYYPYPPCY